MCRGTTRCKCHNTPSCCSLEACTCNGQPLPHSSSCPFLHASIAFSMGMASSPSFQSMRLNDSSFVPHQTTSLHGPVLKKWSLQRQWQTGHSHCHWAAPVYKDKERQDEMHAVRIDICVSSTISLPTLDIQLDGSSIDQVQTYKYLGVVLSDTLSWDKHIQFVHKKAAKGIGLLRRLSGSCQGKPCVPCMVFMCSLSTLLMQCGAHAPRHRAAALSVYRIMQHTSS